MFDGIDLVVLPTSHLTDLTELYAGVMGFTCVTEDRGPDPAVADLLGFAAPPTALRLLAKPRAQGGAILLAETPGLAALGSPGPPARTGPYALDFYARDASALAQSLTAAGWSFTSPAVSYSLPGTDIPVGEQMLVQHRSGLLHAVVQHRPHGTRSVLGGDESEDCSEVVAVVCLTPHLAQARAFATDVLGGQEYFHGAFAGPAVEEMLDLEPGERLDAALFRGPGSRNARLEFAWRPTAAAIAPSDPDRVVIGIETDDLAGLAQRLDGGGHGRLGAPVNADLFGTRRAGQALRSAYGATFAFLAADRP
jgi:catechol 2,3-dioxygenase-like lactoylglutathione lyase family enzyme